MTALHHTDLPTTLQDCRALDAQDPLRHLRDLFVVPEGTIYLDGNSLGAMPASVPARVAQVVQQEWGQDLIQSWNKAGWFEAPRRVGDKIGRLIGAAPGTVIATDSTSINLFKVLSAALRQSAQDAPGRWRIVNQADQDSLVLRSAISAVSLSAEGLKVYEVVPIALVAAAASTAAGTRDLNSEIYIELEAIDGRNSQPMARLVRKGHGLQLENDSTQLRLEDIKPVLDTWAKDARTFNP